MKYLIAIVIVVIAIVSIVAMTQTDTAQPPPASPVNELFSFDESEYDFGTLKQSGGIVTHAFPFTYNGTETLTITGLPTSCGCTSATISSSTLAPGTQGTITVAFDPNLHAEPEGRFYKTVTVYSTPALSPMPELKIWASIDLDLGEDAYKEQIHEGEVLLQTENLAPEKDYRTISATTLKAALEDKHFFLVDVHTPEQEHIDDTDAVIAYDQIAQRLDELPSNKNEPIVLYCRSGSMSQQAAQTLTDLGYTDVIHVEGGMQAFNQK